MLRSSSSSSSSSSFSFTASESFDEHCEEKPSGYLGSSSRFNETHVIQGRLSSSPRSENIRTTPLPCRSNLKECGEANDDRDRIEESLSLSSSPASEKKNQATFRKTVKTCVENKNWDSLKGLFAYDRLLSESSYGKKKYCDALLMEMIEAHAPPEVIEGFLQICPEDFQSQLVNTPDQLGRTPLVMASYVPGLKNRMHLVKILIRFGVDFSEIFKESRVDVMMSFLPKKLQDNIQRMLGVNVFVPPAIFKEEEKIAFSILFCVARGMEKDASLLKVLCKGYARMIGDRRTSQNMIDVLLKHARWSDEIQDIFLHFCTQKGRDGALVCAVEKNDIEAITKMFPFCSEYGRKEAWVLAHHKGCEQSLFPSFKASWEDFEVLKIAAEQGYGARVLENIPKAFKKTVEMFLLNSEKPIVFRSTKGEKVSSFIIPKDTHETHNQRIIDCALVAMAQGKDLPWAKALSSAASQSVVDAFLSALSVLRSSKLAMLREFVSKASIKGIDHALFYAAKEARLETVKVLLPFSSNEGHKKALDICQKNKNQEASSVLTYMSAFKKDMEVLKEALSGLCKRYNNRAIGEKDFFAALRALPQELQTLMKDKNEGEWKGLKPLEKIKNVAEDSLLYALRDRRAGLFVSFAPLLMFLQTKEIENIVILAATQSDPYMLALLFDQVKLEEIDIEACFLAAVGSSSYGAMRMFLDLRISTDVLKNALEVAQACCHWWKERHIQKAVEAQRILSVLTEEIDERERKSSVKTAV